MCGYEQMKELLLDAVDALPPTQQTFLEDIIRTHRHAEMRVVVDDVNLQCRATLSRSKVRNHCAVAILVQALDDPHIFWCA